MIRLTLVAEGMLVFINIYTFILFGRIIMSWFMMGAGGGGNEIVESIYRILFGLTEPLLAPLRSVIPNIRMGMGYLDLSPIVLLILLRIARQVVFQYIYF